MPARRQQLQPIDVGEHAIGRAAAAIGEVDQALATDAVDHRAVAGIAEQRVGVLWEDEEVRLAAARGRGQLLDECDHGRPRIEPLPPQRLERIDAVEIDAVEAGVLDA